VLELADAGDLSRMIKVGINFFKKLKAYNMHLWLYVLRAHCWVKCRETVGNCGEKWSV